MWRKSLNILILFVKNWIGLRSTGDNFLYFDDVRQNTGSYLCFKLNQHLKQIGNKFLLGIKIILCLGKKKLKKKKTQQEWLLQNGKSKASKLEYFLKINLICKRFLILIFNFWLKVISWIALEKITQAFYKFARQRNGQTCFENWENLLRVRKSNLVF